MAETTDQKKTKSFKDTLNLPRTDFPIRSNAKENDPIILKQWEEEKLFITSYDHNQGKEKYILHDGPPYANGNIHLGHAYNKILKDIIGKSQRMQGKHVPIKPGWDCHGLPIELKVTEKLEKGASKKEIQKACREYAQHWVDVQRSEFKKLGVLMGWNNLYITMNHSYESSIMQAFGDFIEGGYIERKNKTVPWCPSCETVLALAEIEYKDRKDPSVYVTFDLEQPCVDALLPELTGKTVSLLVWTTTPWTLPLNRAVLLKPNSEYVVLQTKGKYLVIGQELAEKFCEKLEIPKKIVAAFNSDKLLEHNPRVKHPFIDDQTAPVLLSDTVLLTDGTACVHSAPGCGPEDYEVGIRNNLEIYCPVSPSGTYTEEIKPKELVGISVTKAHGWVIKTLMERNALVLKESIKHSYPHCWRCRGGLIFRATKQWFCNLAQGGLKEKALAAIEQIDSYPKNASNRLASTVEGRLEWCLSRQRVWGVPIPAVLCSDCDFVYVTKELAQKVALGVAKHGVEYWDMITIDELLPNNFSCPECKKNNFKKEQDILDVWFDSGISHYAVLSKDPDLDFPASMYLEGKDQHRGWFQSSLLTALVIEGNAPMRSLITHGFTVDQKGHKMSKSLGNVISPDDIIKRLGTDGLRLWVSSVDYTDDAVLSEVVIKNIGEVLRKIRNTCRFLLSNLYDYDHKKDAVSSETLYIVDQYGLQQLDEFNKKVITAYNNYDFTTVFHSLAEYCSSDLSAFYLDIIKDRLYVEQADGQARRSAQTVCWYILDTLTRLSAPIMSFTAEQLSDCYQNDKSQSIHLQNFATLKPVWNKSTVLELGVQWETLKKLRSVVLRAVEVLRKKGEIKHPLEASITIYLDEECSESATISNFLKRCAEKLQSPQKFLKEFLIASDVMLAQSSNKLQKADVDGVYVGVERAVGTKCPRCWHWQKTNNPDGLCDRCYNIVK